MESFDKYVEDLEDVVQFLQGTYDMKRHILFGHSMGGLITSAYMQERATDDFYPEKVFLSSPAVAATGLLGEFFRYSPLKFNKLLAAAPVSVKLAGVLDLKKLSHDPRVYENYVKDPLNRLKIHSHLFLEILAKSREVFSKPLRIKTDLYVAIGTEDELVNPKACIEYFKKIEKHAKLYVSEGGWHELHNEIERYRVPYLEFLEESIMDSIFN
ncbi:MAG: hypothetical protein CME64_17985 [Halobacteriovoraceae bacterium]|nr:hypothetical protein [Halobacteriovoraceae bacterium]